MRRMHAMEAENTAACTTDCALTHNTTPRLSEPSDRPISNTHPIKAVMTHGWWSEGGAKPCHISIWNMPS